MRATMKRMPQARHPARGLHCAGVSRRPDRACSTAAERTASTATGSLPSTRSEGTPYPIPLWASEGAAVSEAAVGRPVNLEIDVLARYLARMQQVRG